MSDLWNMFIIQPFSWLLLNLYKLTSSYGMALILFALIVKLALLFFTAKGKLGMTKQQRLAPKLKELEKQYKNDKAKYNEAISKLYQQEGVSPMSGCLWSLIPIPVIFALFGVVRSPLTNLMKLSNEQIQTVLEYLNANVGTQLVPENYYIQLEMSQVLHENFESVASALSSDFSGLIDINFRFLGLNLSEIPQWPWNGFSWLLIIPILSGVTAYLSHWLIQKFSGQNNQMQGSMKTMNYFMPLLSVYFAFIMPAAIGVYLIAQNVFGIVQEYFLTRYVNGVLDKEEAAKEALRERRRAAEEKMKEENRLRKQQELSENKNKKKSKVYRVKKRPGGNNQNKNGSAQSHTK